MPLKANQSSFQTTCWSDVRDAVGPDAGRSRRALAALCDAYWYPLYAFIRRSGKTAQDAEDLTQDFFARLLEGKILEGADQEKGKLRTYLLRCLQNFLADERDRAMALKRGGKALDIFNPVWAEECYADEPADDMTPDRLFQRRWALTVLDFALQLLRAEYSTPEKAEVFEALRPFLGFGADSGEGCENISARLGIPVGTLQNQVFRMRGRWRELLFEQVSLTLAEPTKENIQDELFELLGSV
jgi:DNA-directed RNA polymerase specialized sigma24 family protein